MIPFGYDDIGVVLKYVFNFVTEFRDVIILMFLLDLFFMIVRTFLESFGLIGRGAGQEETRHQYRKHWS